MVYRWRYLRLGFDVWLVMMVGRRKVEEGVTMRFGTRCVI